VSGLCFLGLVFPLLTATAQVSSPPEIVHEGIALRLFDVSDRIEIAVTGQNAASTKVFSLGAPNRVVLDIPGVRFVSAGAQSPTPNPLVGGLRFGVHPDKARIVLDILSVDIPPTTLRAEGSDTVTVTLPVAPELRAHFESMRASLTPPKGTGATTSGAEQHDATDIDQTASSLSPREQSGDATAGDSGVAPTPLAPTPLAPTPPTQSLSGLLFETLSDGSSAVRLILNDRPSYSFQKNDKQTYRFTVKNCTLSGEQLALPFYPPDESRGLTVVEPRQIGDDIEVFVGVSPGFRLSSTSSANSISIRAVPIP